MADKVYGIYGTNKCKKEVIPGKIYKLTKISPSTLNNTGTREISFGLANYLPKDKSFDNLIVLDIKEFMYNDNDAYTTHGEHSIILNDTTYPYWYTYGMVSQGTAKIAVVVGNKSGISIPKVGAQVTFMVVDAVYTE